MNKRFDNIVNSKNPVVVDFYADWCVPCRMMAPVLAEVKTEFKRRVKILKVNIDHFPGIAKKFQISSIPTVMVFRKGKVQWSGVGVQETDDITFALRDIL